MAMKATPYRIVDADLSDPEHGSGLLTCLDDYAAGPMGRGYGLEPEVQAVLVARLREQPQRLIRLGLHDGRVVGAAVCFFGFSTFSARPRLNVHDLCVLPEHRGRGLGRELLEAVIEAARAAGCSGVTLEVRSDNEVARRLYRSLGFGAGFAAMEFWERKLE